MECTLITFINNSSNVFRIIILYLFHLDIHMKQRRTKVFYSNFCMFTGKSNAIFKVNLQSGFTTRSNQLLRRGMG